MPMAQVPIVSYLVLGSDTEDAYLEAAVCKACDAHFFDRRNACGRCGGLNFEKRRVSSEGVVRAFTIVHRSAPGVATPFVAAIIDLGDGVRMKANIVDVEPTPENVQLGMPVKLT